MTQTRKRARDLIPGDIIEHKDYPADLIDVIPLPGDRVKLVWGCGDDSVAWMNAGDSVPVFGHFDVV